MLSAGVVALVLPWVLRFTRSYALAANLGVALVMAVLSNAVYLSGGIASFALLTLPLVPLLATFLLGRRGGGVWTLLTLLETTAWAALAWAGRSPPNRFPEATRLQSAGTAAFVICIVVYAVGVLTSSRAEKSEGAAETPAKATEDTRVLSAAIDDVSRRADDPFFCLMGQLASAREAQASREFGEAAMVLKDAQESIVGLRDVLADLRLLGELTRRRLTPTPVDLRGVLEESKEAVAAVDARRWNVRIEEESVPPLLVDPRVVRRLLGGAFGRLAERARDPNRLNLSLRIERVEPWDVVVGFELEVTKHCEAPVFPAWLLEAAGATADFMMKDDRAMLLVTFRREPSPIPVSVGGASTVS